MTEKQIGTITKNYNSYYYVNTKDNILYTCKVRGKIKKNKFSLMTGDKVAFSIISDEDKEGSIEEILPRKNSVLRPSIANIDQMAIVFSLKKPDLNRKILDRFLLMAEQSQIPIVIVFTKKDLIDDDLKLNTIINVYNKIGYDIFCVSNKDETSLKKFKNMLKGKTTVFSGLSGVGKSTLLNNIFENINLLTGKVSDKNEKGRHTTRFTELFPIDDGYVADTPGYTSSLIETLSENDVKYGFKELHDYEGKCRFLTCRHLAEPDCAVKKAVSNGEIDASRYENYIDIMEEVKNYNARRYK